MKIIAGKWSRGKGGGEAAKYDQRWHRGRRCARASTLVARTVVSSVFQGDEVLKSGPFGGAGGWPLPPPFVLRSELANLHIMSSTHWNILSAWSKAGIGTSIVLELRSSPPPPSITSASSSPSKQPSSKPSPRIAFDMGATPSIDAAIPAKYVFLSHGHVDHVGAVFSHARAHAVSCGGYVTLKCVLDVACVVVLSQTPFTDPIHHSEAPTYFVPAPLLPQLQQCRDAMSLLDACNLNPDGEGGRKESLIKMKFVAVGPGDEIVLKGIHFGSKTR